MNTLRIDRLMILLIALGVGFVGGVWFEQAETRREQLEVTRKRELYTCDSNFFEDPADVLTYDEGYHARVAGLPADGYGSYRARHRVVWLQGWSAADRERRSHMPTTEPR